LHVIPLFPDFFAIYSPNAAAGFFCSVSPASQARLALIFKPKRKMFASAFLSFFKVKS